MGLWDWIVDKLAAPAGGSRSAERVGVMAAGDAAVATLDPPHDGQAVETNCEASQPAGDRWWEPEGVTLTDPVEPERPDLCAEALALENVLVSHFDGHGLDIPPMPRVPNVVLKRLRDRDCDFRVVAKDIAEDQVIAAAMLRIANSPLYRGLDKITQLPAAVTRLGIRGVRTLMMHESLHAAVFLSKGGDAELARLIWSRAQASAWIMHGLAPFVGLDEENAFLIGLLHDIGNVIVLRQACSSRAITRFEIDLDTFEYLCHECHQEFGELIAEAWRLPPRLASLIAGHHDYPAEDDPLRTERLALRLADMIAAMLGYAVPVAYNLLESRPVHDLHLVGRSDFVDLLDRLPTNLAELAVIDSAA